MRIKHSLRLKVALSFALFTVLILVALMVGVLSLAEKQAEQLIDATVSGEMSHLMHEYQRSPQIFPPRTQNLHGYIIQNDDENATLPSYLRKLGPGIHHTFVGDRELHIAVRYSGTTKFYLVYDVSRYEQGIKQFRVALLFITAVISALTVWMAFWLAGLLTRQVSDLANQVESLSPNDMKIPLAAKYNDEEVLGLARAFDGYHQRVQELLDREQEFTANASHELRTPLTQIKTSCELIAQNAALDARSKRRLNDVNLAVDHMTETINSLLLLARGGSQGTTDPIPVKAHVDKIINSCTDTLAAKPILLEISIAPEATLQVHRDAFDLVLTNLIKNAIAYTEQGKISVRYEAQRLCIEDTGIGISAADLPHIFERFYRGIHPMEKQSGLGLGLSIVKRICDQSGWRITLHSEENRGTRVMIDFSPV
ncbi:HAMP domain-containing sensor histidine kinase [Sulfuriferula sp.]|uniref:sensor histidine kinase n=1 Tax=Sulfuriferula sp. TaxID=2025307 RepID=UPI00272FFDF9|nr:HAMP domain-containing sensor histidine kinase [Sulfuriferula sp.]MDP2024633.1 HAMP domain-containing sensor histidine kinase [Sulfuriferula sp.]